MFHDPRGFDHSSDEPGHAAVKFLEDAHNAVAPEQQLHAVWYVHVARQLYWQCILLVVNRFCISLAEVRSPSENVLKVLEKAESVGEALTEFSESTSDLIFPFGSSAHDCRLDTV